MSAPAYRQSLTRAKALLKREGLALAIQSKDGHYTLDSVRAMRNASYVGAYRTAAEQRDYEVLLFDNSFVQIQIEDAPEGLHLRYGYYQVPYDVPTYPEFVRQHGFTVEEVGEEFLEDYDQAVAEAALNASAVMIRYDYHRESHSPGVHAASHFHIGWENEIRIPSHRMVSPLVFVLFVIRHVYPVRWRVLQGDVRNMRMIRDSKALCLPVPPECCGGVDLHHLFLS